MRSYLLAHPEVLPEAMDRLHDNQTGQVVAANREAILTPVGSAWAGNPHGDVTLVEYYDYNCGYCRASLPTIRQLLASDPNIRIVYRELPVLAESSNAAARMSLAAAAQGKFLGFHDALYASGPVSDQTIAAAARTAGVDPARAAAYTPQADAEIARNLGADAAARSDRHAELADRRSCGILRAAAGGIAAACCTGAGGALSELVRL